MTQVLSGRLHWRACHRNTDAERNFERAPASSIQINGDGPLGEPHAIADHTGRVRATASNPRAVAPFKSSDDILSLGNWDGATDRHPSFIKHRRIEVWCPWSMVA